MPEEKKKTLAQELDAITFKNKQIYDMTRLQDEKAKLLELAKSKRVKRTQTSASKLQGLEKLGSTLGKQFSKDKN